MNVRLTAVTRPKLCLGETHDALFHFWVWLGTLLEFLSCQAARGFFEKDYAHACFGSQTESSHSHP